jgi:GST-like protein
MSDKIQLYSLATPNGQKIGIALEEMEIPYEAHTINIMQGDQFTPEFIAINPNSKIPAIVDPTGDNGKPLAIMESGAILLYLAEKSGKFLPHETAKKSQAIQWLMWQMGGAGPMFGQFGHFSVYAPKERDLSYGQERYTKEAKRLLSVLENQLKDNKYVAGDELTIADFAIMPWVDCLEVHYQATELLDLPSYKRVNQWKNELLARPKTQAGMGVTPFN